MFDADKLRYGPDGLIPAVAQDFFSGELLMAAYMNRESMEITLREKIACFWSRSRGQLWRKGETSGNFLHIAAVRTDCDADTVLLEVIADGPACHTGSRSCFFETVYEDATRPPFSLWSLYELLIERKANPKEGSYTNYLFDSGAEKILKKIGEESAEVIIGGMKGDKAETVSEIADLCYHLLVLMAHSGITPGDIAEELGRRQVVDHKVKQGGSR